MDYSDIIPDTHIAHYNKRRESLSNKITLLTERLSDDLIHGEDCFIVDSILVPVCRMSRELRTKVCRENYETSCDKRYSAVIKQYYIGTNFI